MELTFWDDDNLALGRLLRAGDYPHVEAWAYDSGYIYDDDRDVWYDDEGYGVDILDMALIAADQAGYYEKEV